MSCLKSDKLKALENDDFADLSIVGTDGGEIACNKAFLAVRSPVFKAMFFGEFKEAQADRCNLDYHSLVISIVVKYCYCDEVDLSLILQQDRSVSEEGAFLIQLRDASKRYYLDKVVMEVETKIGELVFQEEKCRYPCALLTELLRYGETNSPLWEVLTQFAVRRPMECFGPKQEKEDDNGIPDCSPGVLANVLGMIEETDVVVRCLQEWAARECENDISGNADMANQALLNIAKDIDLQQLSSYQLSQLHPCSLFPMERLFEALVHKCSQSETDDESSTEVTSRLLVSGSGIDCLNGFYEQGDYIGPYRSGFFYKIGEYGGESCMFVIYKEPCWKPKWLFSMSTQNYRKFHLDLELCQVNFYEAPYIEDGKVPFNTWEILEATGPTPLVAGFN
mmetsp:Transcript_35701/g.86398  ORF Transcript_35701/g.86398 Transcript_35701/m.86398 type:complete len:394 (-) Transcript_35701:73-1254(-)